MIFMSIPMQYVLPQWQGGVVPFQFMKYACQGLASL